MKRTILIALVMLLTISAKIESNEHYIKNFVTKTEVAPTYEETRQELLEAIILVETQGDSTAVGDGGKAVGILQIHPIMVREVNNCAKKLSIEKEFTYEDRKSQSKSIEMFWIWAKCHHAESSNEKIARNWNGGPNGYKNKATKYYWSKVKKELELIEFYAENNQK